MRAETRHLRPGNTSGRQISKTGPHPFVCEAVGECIGLRQARGHEIAAVDLRNSALTDDLAVVRQRRHIALHLVEEFRNLFALRRTKEELSSVHRFGLRASTPDDW